MARRSDIIQRDYRRGFFNKRRSYARLYFDGFLIALIIAVPLVASLYFDSLRLAVWTAVGQAPTRTPFASERAERGQQLYLAGDLDSALLFYEQAARQQPNNIAYLYEYGRTLIEVDRTSEATVIGDQIIALDSDDPRGYALKAASLVWRDPAAAIPVALAGVELGQQYAPLHAALAVAYNNIGRYQEALQQGDLAVRLDPLNATVRRSFSYPLIYTGRYNEAIAQLEQAISINPNITSPYFELASLYRILKQPEMAVAIFNRVIEVEPDSERAYLRLCETYAEVGLFQEAEPFCDRALVIDPDYASAHRMRGQLRYSRRNYEGAIESFEQCVQLGSQEIECYYIRGLAHYFLGNCDQAWDILNDALLRIGPGPVQDNIKIGLTNITIRCAGYQGRSLPTPIPPTPIPPTPIGGT